MTILAMHYQAFIYVSLRDFKCIHILNFFKQYKISSSKEVKNSRLKKIMRELKNIEDAMEQINKIEKSETNIIIESTKRELNAIGKEKKN